MRIALTGASGFLGGALVADLRGGGHEVVRLVRRTPTRVDEAQWDPQRGSVDLAALRDVDAVIHLAGAGLGDRPWTPGYKREVLDSRVRGTTTIARAVAEAGTPALLSMSGVGYYGNPGDAVVDESAPAGSTYVAEIARRWEEATTPARDSGSRVVLLRTAPVLAAKGGAFGRLLPIFRLGLGGRLGSGRQWWSWVSIDDYVAAVRFLLERGDASGAYNVTAPHPLTNAELTAAMGRVLHRPTVTWVPGMALKVPLRDFAVDLLAGQRVVPTRLTEAGFTFRHPDFEPALRELLGR